ncbi:hypothetical protein [Pelagibius sp.]|uniref:hypothetical protein n=1 Tax=Pelagibius sp. TaxID=1931238 RepID=UPI003BAE6616
MSDAARQLAQKDYLSLKAAFRHLVDLAGGCELAAEQTRVQKTSISDYGKPHMLAAFPPADVVADLQAAVGSQIFTRTLKQIGRAYASQGAGLTGDDVMAMSVRLQGELGEFAIVALDANADGVLSVSEVNRLIKEARDVANAANHTVDQLLQLRDKKAAGPREVRDAG